MRMHVLIILKWFSNETIITTVHVFWDVMPCKVMNIHQCFGEAYRPIHQD